MSGTKEHCLQRAASQPVDLGPMPVWDLGDLYAGPQSEAVEADLRKAAAEARCIKETYEGRLSGLAREGAPFGEAIAAYEAVSDTLGKLGAYAGLLYASDRSNSGHARFYGNMQEQLTAITTDLLFFELEINRLADPELAAALKAPAVARYQPWLEDLRKEKPYQLEERLERLFYEKTLTAGNAWNR
jgi:oligoendopeptidase F